MFLYFHQTESNNRPNLKQIGLDYICDDRNMVDMCQVVGIGPNGGRGFVVGNRCEGRQVLFDAQLQDWRCIAGRWIGLPKGIDLKPAMFQRDTLLDGHNWTDWKGNVWKIPVARKWHYVENQLKHFVNLPMFMGINDDGELVAKGVQSKYETLWKVACNYQNNMLKAIADTPDGETVSWSAGDLKEICDAAIGANYRLSHLELGMMEILSDRAAVEIVSLIVDNPGYEQLQKKIQLGTGTT